MSGSRPPANDAISAEKDAAHLSGAREISPLYAAGHNHLFAAAAARSVSGVQPPVNDAKIVPAGNQIIGADAFDEAFGAPADPFESIISLANR